MAKRPYLHIPLEPEDTLVVVFVAGGFASVHSDLTWPLGGRQRALAEAGDAGLVLVLYEADLSPVVDVQVRQRAHGQEED